MTDGSESRCPIRNRRSAAQPAEANGRLLCTSEQRSVRLTHTVGYVGLQYTRGVIAGAWILTAGFIGVLGNVTSIAAGALILGFGLLPPLILILRGGSAPVHNSREPRG